MGLVEAGATVFITGRNPGSLAEACRAAEAAAAATGIAGTDPASSGPGRCVPKVVDSADDASLEQFFTELETETSGRLDILVNNAYAADGQWPSPSEFPKREKRGANRASPGFAAKGVFASGSIVG